MTLLIFILLLLPGYVAIKHVSPQDEACGLPGMIGLSFLATLAILSPFSIAGYLLHLPVGAFAILCLLLVIAAPVEITRRKWWPDAGRLLVSGLTIAMLVLVADVVLSARVGAYLLDDALIHLARIRHILNHGLNNTDPLVAADYFFPMYHTNLLYALVATIAKITGQDPLAVWASSLTWVKLLVASGSYYLAYTIFGRRWPAWAAAVFVIGTEGPVRFLIYPNKLAPFWIMPIVFAFAAQIVADGADWRRFTKLLAGVLVVGQLHGMYAVFIAMVVGPVLAANAVYRVVRRDKSRLWPALCAATLGVGLVFAWISNSSFASTSAPAGETAQRDSDVVAHTKTAADFAKGENRYRAFEDGSIQRIWGLGYFSHGAMRPKVLLLALALCLVTRRRKYALAPVGIIAISLAWLFVPMLCTLFMETVRRPFILSRFESIFRVSFYAIVPALAVFGLEKLLQGEIWGKRRDWCLAWATKWNRHAVLRWPVEGIVCLIVLMLIVPYKNYGKPEESRKTGWERYWTKAKEPEAERTKRLSNLLKLGEYVSTKVDAGSVIALSPREGRSMILPAVCDCRLVAPRAGSTGVPDLAQRRRDMTRVYTLTVPLEERMELLQKYEADFAVGPDPLIPDAHASSRSRLWPPSKLIKLNLK